MVSNVGYDINKLELKKEKEFRSLNKKLLKQNAAHNWRESGNEDTADLADQENTKLMAWEQVALLLKHFGCTGICNPHRSIC